MIERKSQLPKFLGFVLAALCCMSLQMNLEINTLGVYSSGVACGGSDEVPSSVSGGVGIAVVSDAKYQKLQALLYDTHRAYAARHSYDYFVLNPADEPSCRLTRFFFNKHCAVRMHLGRQPKNYTLLVLDGDVLAASLEVSLDRWLSLDADIVLYEREWNFEIMAGNYMIRNSPLGLYFLETWMQFEHRAHSITGYNSADNGAIHLAVPQVLGLHSFKECHVLYQNLKSRVKNLTEYFDFIACTRRAMGPINRLWRVRSGIYPGVIAIMHRYHGFAIDRPLTRWRLGGAVPFYHSIKEPRAEIDGFASMQAWESAAAQGETLARQDDFYVVKTKLAYRSVPRIRLEACITDFSCRLATDDYGPSTDFYERNKATLIFNYTDLYG